MTTEEPYQVDTLKDILPSYLDANWKTLSQSIRLERGLNGRLDPCSIRYSMYV